jgi:ankyrin
MWRQDPSIIQSRRADATYGIGVGLIFDPSKHDEHYQYRDEDGDLRCGKVFKVFIDKGEVSEIEDIYTTEIIPLNQAKTEMSIPIYSTYVAGVQYILDKSDQMTVKEIGQLIIAIPNPDNKPRKEREVKVSMSFSGTEIKAKAKYCITEEEVKIVCDFLSNQDSDKTQ